MYILRDFGGKNKRKFQFVKIAVCCLFIGVLFCGNAFLFAQEEELVVSENEEIVAEGKEEEEETADAGDKKLEDGIKQDLVGADDGVVVEEDGNEDKDVLVGTETKEGALDKEATMEKESEGDVKVLENNNPGEGENGNISNEKGMPRVVISEIAWMGTEVSINDEWIELRNLDEEEVLLEGWSVKSDDGTPNILLTGKISAFGFFLLERTDDDTVVGVKADQIYTGALGNSGENLKLINAEGNVIDEVDCGKGWFAGNNDSKLTMELSEDEKWQDSKNQGGTPREKYEAKEGGDEEDGEKPELPLEQNFDIFINELLPDPVGGGTEEEWIEIFNNGEGEVSLAGWKIIDAGGKIFSFQNETICSKCFRILYYSETKIALNNAGDAVRLLEPSGKIAQEISYRGDMEEGWLWSRTPNGEYQWNSVSTPGEPNKFPQKKVYSKDVFLSEVLPNPNGIDTDQEWIELGNKGNAAVDLDGWYFENYTSSGNSHKFKIVHATIQPKSLLAIQIKKDDLNKNFSLKNSKELINLRDPNGEIVDFASFSESAGSGLSYNKSSSGQWRWSRFLTPGKINRLNNLPNVIIKKTKKVYKNLYAEFDASKTKDKDGDKLKYRWDFGDGHRSYLEETKHKYEKNGKYMVELQVDDGSEKITKTFKVEVRSFPKYELGIEKIVPNPKGKDTGNEIVAIANYEKKKIDLEGYYLATGASKNKLVRHPIYGSFVLNSGELAELFNKELCKFSLRNTSGAVALLYPNGKIADIVKYQKEKISDGEAYEKIGGQWEWVAGVEDIDEKAKEDVQTAGASVESEKRFDFLLLTINEEEKVCECLSKIKIENWKSKNKNWLNFAVLGI